MAPTSIALRHVLVSVVLASLAVARFVHPSHSPASSAVEPQSCFSLSSYSSAMILMSTIVKIIYSTNLDMLRVRIGSSKQFCVVLSERFLVFVDSSDEFSAVQSNSFSTELVQQGLNLCFTLLLLRNKWIVFKGIKVGFSSSRDDHSCDAVRVTGADEILQGSEANTAYTNTVTQLSTHPYSVTHHVNSPRFESIGGGDGSGSTGQRSVWSPYLMFQIGGFGGSGERVVEYLNRSSNGHR